MSTLKGESEAPSYYTNLIDKDTKRHLANQFLSVAMKSNGRSLPETGHSILLPINSPNIGRFSKFFHPQTNSVPRRRGV